MSARNAGPEQAAAQSTTYFQTCLEKCNDRLKNADPYSFQITLLLQNETGKLIECICAVHRLLDKAVVESYKLFLLGTTLMLL